MAVLRPLCVPQTVNAPKLQNLKFMKCLQLTVLQAARLPNKIVPMPYCLVALNQVTLSYIFIPLLKISAIRLMRYMPEDLLKR